MDATLRPGPPRSLGIGTRASPPSRQVMTRTGLPGRRAA
jgi:hypothetical protein